LGGDGVGVIFPEPGSCLGGVAVTVGDGEGHGKSGGHGSADAASSGSADVGGDADGDGVEPSGFRYT
jgi:hypothetical protein